MRTSLQIITVLALFGIGILIGRHFLSPDPLKQSGLFADQALARAVIEAGAIELAESDCALSTPPGGPATVADFILGYILASQLSTSTLNSECGGRGSSNCSVSYSVMMGEKADTNILLFERDSEGKLIMENVTCIAQ